MRPQALKRYTRRVLTCLSFHFCNLWWTYKRTRHFHTHPRVRRFSKRSIALSALFTRNHVLHFLLRFASGSVCACMGEMVRYRNMNCNLGFILWLATSGLYTFAHARTRVLILRVVLPQAVCWGIISRRSSRMLNLGKKRVPAVLDLWSVCVFVSVCVIHHHRHY